jgi:hypothetical protein
MLGPSPFAAKVMGVFVDMDKMIGKVFEAGLANLKGGGGEMTAAAIQARASGLIS